MQNAVAENGSRIQTKVAEAQARSWQGKQVGKREGDLGAQREASMAEGEAGDCWRQGLRQCSRHRRRDPEQRRLLQGRGGGKASEGGLAAPTKAVRGLDCGRLDDAGKENGLLQSSLCLAETARRPQHRRATAHSLSLGSLQQLCSKTTAAMFVTSDLTTVG